MQNGKDKIIERIISDNQAKCQKVIEEANISAQNILSEANAQIESDALRLKNRLAEEKEQSLKLAISAAELDAKKYTLASKQDILSSAFLAAEKQIRSLSANDYLELIKKLLKKYSQKGEMLLISKEDKSVITESVVAPFGLKLAETAENFDGGFILAGKGYEKNITLAVIMQELRFENEIEVARILFEGV